MLYHCAVLNLLNESPFYRIVDTYKKQLKNKIKLKFYLYLESTKPQYQILLLSMGVSLFAVCFRLPASLIKIMKDEISKGDFKTVFRRMWWLNNQLLLNGRHRYDRYFDFSIGLNTISADAMYERLEKKHRCSRRGEKFNLQIHLAQLAAARIDGDLAPNGVLLIDKEDIKKKDESYVAHINSALHILKLSELSYDPIKRQQNQSKDAAIKTEVGSTDKKSFSPRKNQFGEYAETVYASFLKLLEDVNIEVFAISGTLLGIIRENAFLAHDYDIDLGIFEEVDFELLLATIENSELFYIKKADYPSFREICEKGVVRYHRYADPALIKIGHRNTGVHIDLFTHFHQDGVMWHGSTLHRWDNSLFSLTEREFLGLNVLIPENHDLYLSENYGDWRTPVTKFNCSTGTPNASISANPRTLCYYIKLCFDDRYNQASYTSLLETLLSSGLITRSNNTYTLK